MTITAQNVGNVNQRIGYALIRTRSPLTIMPIITTGLGLESLLVNMDGEEAYGMDVAYQFNTERISPLPCEATRIVLAKLEILIEQRQALGLNVESLKLGLAQAIAILQRDELVRR